MKEHIHDTADRPGLPVDGAMSAALVGGDRRMARAAREAARTLPVVAGPRLVQAGRGPRSRPGPPSPSRRRR